MTPQGYGTQRPLALDEVAGGVAAVFLSLVVFPLTVVIFSAAVSDILGALAPEPAPIVVDEEDELPPVEVMETRFVRLGAPPDRRMPDRYVPTAATAPTPSLGEVTDAVPSTEPVVDPTGIRQPTDSAPQTPEQRAADARNDLLNRLGDSAAATAELAEPRMREGDLEGVAEGTATREEGNIYLGQLQAFFKRGWQPPSSIASEELRTLRAVVSVEITSDGRVGGTRISRPSGNDSFDASVRQRLEQAEGAAVPPPPPEVADQYLGRSISFSFSRRN